MNKSQTTLDIDTIHHLYKNTMWTGTLFLYGACSYRGRFIPLRKTARTVSHILIEKFYCATNRHGISCQLETYMALSAQIGQMTNTGSQPGICIFILEERQSLWIRGSCLSLVALSIEEAKCTALLKGAAMSFRLDNLFEKSTTPQQTTTQPNSQQRSLQSGSQACSF